MKEVYIVSAVRTPMGRFLGSLSTVPATMLGATAIKGALDKIDLSAEEVEEVFMGNVLQAGLGQAPARQAALDAGIPVKVPCTTINKVCSSGLKAVMLGAQAIQNGDAEVIVAGGMENMSMVPFYQPSARTGKKYGDAVLIDGLSYDGLLDPYDKEAMGVFADLCAKEYKISREEQDAFAIQSYKRSTTAWAEGRFNEEIVPVEVPQRRGEPVVVSEDEEFKNVKIEKVPQLRPAFTKDGTVTAANASTMNDGASAVVLMSKEKVEQLGLTPLAKIVSFADAALEPKWFTIAPSKALPKAVEKADLKISDLDYVELNEAFSVVGVVNIKEMGLDPEKVNVNGGAVSLGHPLGNSGSRILVTLINVLKQNAGKYGGIGICNGGGGASAMVIENV
ncbi:acetyl-CoA C-acyltransferase [Flavobacteriaceae bacterium Ap0902]|nr:acetyl-CoA C-acyltransferase [Flavobacteriaceae bacterium Ap0902]